MKVSVLTSIPWLDPSSSQTQAYREAIEQVRFAVELGYDCFWFTEHHFGTHGINSSVLSWAAYVAGIAQAHPDRYGGGGRTALSARSAR
jgi:hypothetical protein